MASSNSMYSWESPSGEDLPSSSSFTLITSLSNRLGSHESSALLNLLCAGGSAPMTVRQSAPVVASPRPSPRTQGGQGAASAPDPARARAEWIHLNVFCRSTVKVEDKFVRLLVTKSSPMLDNWWDTLVAWCPLQMLKSTQFSITTKASFRYLMMAFSISGSGAALALLILSRPPPRAAMMAERLFSSPAI